jgi:hypothetical protein
MSANVIVFTQRMDFRTLLEIECKGLTGFAPVIKDSIEELRSFLTLGSDIEILVVDDPQENIVQALAMETQIKNILVLSDKQFQIEKSISFQTNTVESLINHLKTILNPNVSNQTGYISIPVDSLIHFKMLPFDLFIKISEEKYLKRIPSNEEIDESTIKGFKLKGILEMHFERKNNRDFSLMLLNNMINKVESDYSSEDDKFKATNDVFLTTKEIVQSVGLPPKVVQVCESVMERITIDVMSQKDKFSNYITEAKSATNLNFQFRFIELSSFIATQIVDISIDGNKDEQIKTIVFASFFSDIALKESNQLEYRTEESIQDLWVEDKKFIQEHAFRASEIVAKYKNAPGLAGEIIKQHHGALDGKSIPRQYSDNLLPLSKCLIASQELAYGILKNPNVPVEETVHAITQKFKGTVIHAPLKIFEDSIEKVVC